MATATDQSLMFRDLLVTTKDGDWGENNPCDGFIPFRVIRGADFPGVRVGDVSSVPLRYVDASTVQRRTLEPDDIIIETAGGNRDRPTGRTLLITEHLLKTLDLPATCASFCRFLRADASKLEPRYLFWYLQYLYSRGEMWEHQVQHTGVARFQYTKFAETTAIPLPPRSSQRAIARILGGLDDKIELNRRTNETLEAMARAVFKSWFVGFDPVRAKADGRQPPGMDAETAALFPDRFEDSPLGRVPKGWLAGTVSDDFGLTMGQSPPGETYNEVADGMPFFQGCADFGVRYPTVRVFCTAPTRLAKPGDTLISVRAPVGDINMSLVPCAVGRGVAAVRHKSGSRSYTYYAMQAQREAFLRFEAEGTVFGSIGKDDFKSLTCVIPPAATVQRFEQAVGASDQMIEKNEAESRTLAALRDGLLPKLLSGEIRVGYIAQIQERIQC